MQPRLNNLPGPEATGSYARGPAEGVDYFSDTGRQQGVGNLNPGLSSLQADAETPDAGMRLLKPETGNASSYDKGSTVSDATLAGAFMSGERGGVLGALGGQIGSVLGGGVGGALAGGIGSQVGSKLGGSYIGGGMGAEGLFYSNPAGLFSSGGPEARTAAQFGQELANITNLSAKDIIDASAAARAEDPLGAFMTEQGIISMPRGPVGYANIAPTATDEFGTPTRESSLGSMSAAESNPGKGPNSAGDTRLGNDYGSYTTSFAADGGMATDQGFVRPGLPESYADGGAVGGAPLLAMGFANGGMVPMGAPGGMQGMGGQPDAAQVAQQVNQMLRDPNMRQRLVARAQQLMSTGELTPQEVVTMARVAEAALYNPSLYPQLRQFVAEQGMAPLPPSYDQSVIVRIMAIAKALQSAQPATPPGQVPPTDQAQMQNPVPGMANGGFLQGPGTGRSDSIGTINESNGQPVKVANGEYVIPEHVVRAKGREFFDNLLRRYADVPKEQA